MKILIFGGTGLLGSALTEALKQDHEVVSLTHAQTDVCDKESVKNALDLHLPQQVINASGYTAVDKAEEEPGKAFEINSDAVKSLAVELQHRRIPFTHFSTDYVFDGESKDGYAENAKTNPINLYGASKAAGEWGLMTSMRDYLLIRTSWLYGAGGRNFVDTILERVRKDKSPLSVVNDQRGCPTSARDLAHEVKRLLEASTLGVYHVVNSGSCTWYELAREVFQQLGVPQEVLPVASTAFPRPAKRPASSILLNTHLPPLQSWQDALGRYLQDSTIIL